VNYLKQQVICVFFEVEEESLIPLKFRQLQQFLWSGQAV